MVKRCNFNVYVECSARNQSNLDTIFENAGRVVLGIEKNKEEKSCCNIL